MKASSDIISFDLVRGGSAPLDVSSFYPISAVHAIRSTKPLLDTISRQRPRPITLSFPRILSISSFHTFFAFDIGHSSFASERGLTPRKKGGDTYDTIDIVPPLSIPYGALDVRGDAIKNDKKYGDIYRRSLPWSLHARRMTRESARYLRKRRRPIILTLCLALSLTIPVLFYTKSLIEHAYADLLEIKDQKNPENIIRLIHSSRGDFERANLLFVPFRYLPGESIALARIAIDGGLSLSRGLDRIALDIGVANTGSIITPSTDTDPSLYRPIAKDIRPLMRLGITEPTSWIEKHRASVEYLAQALGDAGRAYAQAGNINHPRASEIAHIGRGLQKIQGVMDQYFAHEKDILALLGADMPVRYIIFNQNRDEIRANGGFPGSIITFSVFRGNIEEYRTDDVYYYDWNLYPWKESPPPGLSLLSNNYGLRDVNYYPDFRDTLEKANTFIEKSGDPTVTVGIALHQGLIEDILSVIGPVSLSGVTETFRADNFSLLMSVLVESRYGEETSAKDILRRFVDAFVAKIHEKRSYEEVITLIEKSFQNGEILIASRNNTIDQFLAKIRKPLPWDEGREKISETPQIGNTSLSDASTGVDLSGVTVSSESPNSQPQNPNWAYPLLTSLSGNKSDRIIARSYKAETTNIGTCRYMNKLTFIHTLTFSKILEDQVRSYLSLIGIREKTAIEKMLAIQGKSKNVTYMRVLVPENAVLTGSTAGLTVSDTSSAKEIAFSLDTPVSGSASKIVRYTLEIPNCTPTTPLVSWYHQPGLIHTYMVSQ